jgi:hypothetical protein
LTSSWVTNSNLRHFVRMIHVTREAAPKMHFRELRGAPVVQARFGASRRATVNVARGRQMKLKRDLHLEISRKLQKSVGVKVFAFRADRDAERVCLGSLHMPESYMRVFRSILEYGAVVVGARVTVGGSYFSSGSDIPDDAVLSNPAP